LTEKGTLFTGVINEQRVPIRI